MINIKTKSRYGDVRTIELTDQTKGIFKIQGKSMFCRVGEGMFDFEGGPMLQIGEEFYGFGTIASLKQETTLEEGMSCVCVGVDYNEKTILELQSR